MRFRVMDNKTGKEADAYEIALHEEWAQGLVYCDMEGFAITENGDLMLADECGNFVYCDSERFKVVFEEERPHGEWIKFTLEGGFFSSHKCSKLSYTICPNCGASMGKLQANGEQVKGGDEK